MADVISFGVAPAILAFSWGLESLGRLGWAVGFMYVTATAMRLARFNIQAKGDRRYFLGLPSPAAAGVVASTVFAYPNGLEGVWEATVALGVMAVPAAMMVSRIRFRSFSALTPRRRHSYLSLLLIAGVVAAIAIHPQVVLALMAYSYLLSGPIGIVWSKVRKRHHTADSDDVKVPASERRSVS